eukprot:gene13189-biopygen3578
MGSSSPKTYAKQFRRKAGQINSTWIPYGSKAYVKQARRKAGQIHSTSELITLKPAEDTTIVMEKGVVHHGDELSSKGVPEPGSKEG